MNASDARDTVIGFAVLVVVLAADLCAGWLIASWRGTADGVALAVGLPLVSACALLVLRQL